MKLSVQAKLLGAFGVLVIALVVIGAMAIVQLGQVGDQADVLFTQNLKTETKTGIFRRDMLLMREAILEYPLAPEERRHETATKIADLEAALIADLASLREQTGLTDLQRSLLDETNLRSPIGMQPGTRV